MDKQYVTEEQCRHRMTECEDCLHKIELKQMADSTRLDLVTKIGWYILTALILGFTGTIGATVFSAVMQ